MDAAAWLADNAELRTPEGSFACREGCGFCCTYPPKVSGDRLAAIEEERGSTQTARDAHGNRRLPLQGGCGGCVLLEERVCQAHQHRPDHCRLFPFHVYLGRSVEVVVDRVCPGVAPDDAPAGPHEPAEGFASWEPARAIDEAAREALTVLDGEELAERARRVRQLHEAVEAQARWMDDWRPPAEAIDELLPDATVTERAWEQALEPFGAEDVAQLPTSVLPDEEGFPWRAWRIRDDQVEMLRFDEEGRSKLVATAPAPTRPRSELAEPVQDTLAALAELEPFVGTCMHLVEQGRSIEEAVERRLADVAAGLALHAQLLEAEGLPVTTAWLRSVYEPEFYSLQTLGEWM